MNEDTPNLQIDYVDSRHAYPRHPTRRWQKRDVNKFRGAVVHQSLGGNGDEDSIRRLCRFHVGSNHISDNGLPYASYTWGVTRKGTIHLLNDLSDKVYSHGTRNFPGDENANFISICAMGKFSYDNYIYEEPSLAQKEAIADLWEAHKVHYGFTNWDLYGHYHVSGKRSCPGTTLRKWIEKVNSDLDFDIPFDLDTKKGRQSMLKALGYYKMEVDGLWGRGSRQALIDFQEAHGYNELKGTWSAITYRDVVREYWRQLNFMGPPFKEDSLWDFINNFDPRRPEKS